jgi:cytoplasmic tRNA 2-thiolation protein 1
MAEMEKNLRSNEDAEASGIETEVMLRPQNINGPGHDRDQMHGNEPHVTMTVRIGEQQNHNTFTPTSQTIPIRPKAKNSSGRKQAKDTQAPRQRLGQCERCGYLSSQAICKACVLLEGLNKARPQTAIEVNSGVG